MSTSLDALRAGAVVDGKYQLVERLGTGGMGTVYKALHLSLGAPRALKVMRPELAGDPGLAARFRTEARLAESLRHPHLVALYDFGQLPDGGWYIVSEFVDGATIALLLKRRGVHFSSFDVARLVGQLADGLSLAHRKGVVHRDISPDNIMLTGTDGGEVVSKLLDFGIAKDVGGASPSLTGAGWHIGKIGFSSPEQMGLLAKGDMVDGRSDVFSLAAVAYLMLTGRLPWRRDGVRAYTHDLLLRPVEELVAEVRAHAPPAWREVFVDAMARERHARVASMAQLKERMAEAARATLESGVAQPPPFRADLLRSSAREAEGTLPAAAASAESGPLTPASSGPVVTPADAFRDDLRRLEIEPPAPSAPRPRRRVVVLDDDEALRRILPGLLDGPDLSATAGPWRGDPVAFAAAQGPDLILLDVDTTETMAVARLHRLRQEPRLRQVPVVFFSSADEWTLRGLVRHTGASGYLAKSSLGLDIGAAVRRWLPKEHPGDG